jgi:hypothetical protein
MNKLHLLFFTKFSFNIKCNSHNSVNVPLEVVRENVQLLPAAGFILNAARNNLTFQRLRYLQDEGVLLSFS